MAGASKPTLTRPQLEIINFFWEHGELGVAQVWELLSARRKIARNTVQTTLTRLVDKGWLKVRVESNAFYFRAARARRATLRQILSQLVDTAFGGSASGLVMTLLENRQVSREEAQRIRELIDRTQEEKR